MTSADHDVIVIGSGAGGAAAAYRLVLSGLRVLLLEKGPQLPVDGSTLDIRRVVHNGEFLSREAWTDGRGVALRPEEHFNVGGKTKWYGAALLRFSDREFLPDVSHDCRGWPIAAADLVRYYDEVERLLGVRTFECEPDLARIVSRLQSSKGWRSQAMPLGLAPNITSEPHEASHFDGFSSARMLKAEAETSLLSKLRANDRFELLTNAEVVALIGDPVLPVAVRGVRLRDGRIYHARCAVFLAAGALHSPRLLSRYLSDTGLDTMLPAAAFVGRFLKLHLLTAMVAVSPRLKNDLLRKTLVLLNDRFPHSSVQPLGFDAELMSTLMPQMIPGALRRTIARRAYGFFLQTEDGSHFDNRVYDGKPPVLDYRAARLPNAEREHRQFARALQGTLLRTGGLVSFTKRIGLNGTAHACGSLVCGATPSDSVVDPSGLVHGMKGLYVVDGSVLPRSSSVNPSLTIYAWGLRVADLLARDRQRLQSLEQSDERVATHVQ